MVVQILLNLLKLSDEKLNRYLAPVSHGGSFCLTAGADPDGDLSVTGQWGTSPGPLPVMQRTQRDYLWCHM